MRSGSPGVAYARPVGGLNNVLGHAVGLAFVALALAALRDWIRTPDRERALIAVLLGLFGALGLVRQVTVLSGSSVDILAQDVRLITFLAAAYALLLLRDTLLPLPQGFRSAMAIAVGVTAVGGPIANSLSPGGRSPLHVLAVGLYLGVSVVCIGEPALRFWLAARDRPLVQRARLRALAGGCVATAVLPVIVGTGVGGTGGSRALVQSVALVMVPLLRAAFSPPAWLRRHWRHAEEDAYLRATTELLALSHDRAALAERTLEWATRLVGAETGYIRSAEGELLAVRGPVPDTASGPPAGLLVIPLDLEAGTGVLAVRPGPFTPLLGSDEAVRLRQYAASMGVALDRARLIGALEERMDELARIAASDPLTGLANRREFERLLAEPRTQGYAILAIDVDDLKVVNDLYGHEAGDEQLRAIAVALRGGLRSGDWIARTGGDEFAALLPGADLTEAAAVAERLRGIMQGVVVPHATARVSIGCAAGAAGADAVALWGASDDALYLAKDRGRDRVECANDADAAPGSVPSLARWQPVLGSILAGGRLHAVFQPIVDLRYRNTVAHEALARPSDGSLDGGVESLFVAAERLGVGRDLDWLCRRVALRDARGLPAGCPVFVNVGSSALLDPVHDVDQMLLLLRWAGRDPEECVLEISEREAVRDLRRLREVLCLYREQGFRFALDDVGEGHSTFEVLAAAVPEFVKISARLTRHARERGAGAVIHSLVAFAERTGTQLVAEGIESAADALRVQEIGVPLGQGFWLGRPVKVPPADAADGAGERTPAMDTANRVVSGSAS